MIPPTIVASSSLAEACFTLADAPRASRMFTPGVHARRIRPHVPVMPRSAAALSAVRAH